MENKLNSFQEELFQFFITAFREFIERYHQPFQQRQSEKYLDSADVKQMLKVSDSTLYRWRKKNEIKYIKIRGKIYYSISSLFDNLK